ncbi:hypothetical protein UY3_11611 [Chelonia mydas]|uniref:Uncharacterized protein n=1 Tax=Chelonia mydas TaxID=8469 RepID=M7BSY7_CHEMY|nr:hypothetical protein UY3_11611 [Chelonia mydas]
MRPVGRGILHGLRSVLCFLAAAIIFIFLIRIGSIFLFSLFLPGVVLVNKVGPAILVCFKALLPITEVLLNELFRALVIFLISLSPPIFLYLCLQKMLLPVFIKLLRLAWRLLAFLALVLCYDLILRIAFIFLMLLWLPGVVFSQQVFPAMLILCQTLMPCVDVMANHLLPALGIFLASLSLPVFLFFCFKLILLPFYFKLFQLVFLAP